MNTTKSQERLIGGKKVRSSIEHLQQQQQHHHQLHHGHQYTTHTKLRTPEGSDLPLISKLKSESELIEKLKRNVKKTQATQTDCLSARKLSFSSSMSMSPRSAHRVCINGNVVGRNKLTKSFSEAMTRRALDESINM